MARDCSRYTDIPEGGGPGCRVGHVFVSFKAWVGGQVALVERNRTQIPKNTTTFMNDMSQMDIHIYIYMYIHTFYMHMLICNHVYAIILHIIKQTSNILYPIYKHSDTRY